MVVMVNITKSENEVIQCYCVMQENRIQKIYDTFLFEGNSGKITHLKKMPKDYCTWKRNILILHTFKFTSNMQIKHLISLQKTYKSEQCIATIVHASSNKDYRRQKYHCSKNMSTEIHSSYQFRKLKVCPLLTQRTSISLANSHHWKFRMQGNSAFSSNFLHSLYQIAPFLFMPNFFLPLSQSGVHSKGGPYS